MQQKEDQERCHQNTNTPPPTQWKIRKRSLMYLALDLIFLGGKLSFTIDPASLASAVQWSLYLSDTSPLFTKHILIRAGQSDF